MSHLAWHCPGIPYEKLEDIIGENHVRCRLNCNLNLLGNSWMDGLMDFLGALTNEHNISSGLSSNM